MTFRMVATFEREDFEDYGIETEEEFNRHFNEQVERLRQTFTNAFGAAVASTSTENHVMYSIAVETETKASAVRELLEWITTATVQVIIEEQGK